MHITECGRFFFENGYCEKQKPKLDFEFTLEEVKFACECQGWGQVAKAINYEPLVETWGIPNKRAELDKFPRSKVDEFIEYVLAFRTEEEATKAANELKEKIKISIEKNKLSPF